MNRMNGPRAVVGGGVLLGLLGDALLRNADAPGLGLCIWLSALVAGTVAVGHGTRGRLSTESYVWLGVATVASTGVTWRDSPALNLLALSCVAAALSFPALRAGAGWMRRAAPGDYLRALACSALFGAVGAAAAASGLRALAGVAGAGGAGGAPAGGEAAGSGLRHAAAAGRGVVMAVPLLLVFGGLFSSADQVFADMVADTLSVDGGAIAAHVAVFGITAWLATGYLHGFVGGTGRVLQPGVARALPRIGITEVAVATGLLNLLFLFFVAVQFRYLFGGASLVLETSGLTYAEYARRGFFELVLAVTLVVPLLLVADALLRRTRRADDVVFRALAAVQVLLVLAIAVSALERMRLYRAAYGLTEQRVYATALLVLVVVVLVWFAATVLQGRRRDFAWGAVIAAFAAVGVLHVLNPDALIARTNLARAGSVVDGLPALDVSYATSLSGDAVPVLVSALGDLPVDARCDAARRLLRRWTPDTQPGLRGWNLADARARGVVRARAASLRALADDARCGGGRRNP